MAIQEMFAPLAVLYQLRLCGCPLFHSPSGLVLSFCLLHSPHCLGGWLFGAGGWKKLGSKCQGGGGDAANAAAAKVIYLVRKNGNPLLYTLLLGNVAVNALLSILLADKVGGPGHFIASTFLIVIFREIAPQAICPRHALQIGSKTVPLVKLIMFLIYPVGKPACLCP